MRGFTKWGCAQVDCAGHCFVRNLSQGFYRLGLVMGDPQIPRPPRLARARDALAWVL
jgi:hypothetical protein